MPHNLVIVKPGTREKIGLASAKMKPDDLDGEGRAFIPDSPDILAATKLIEPRQKTALKLTAPTEEGAYEYFCTYPGHYLIMWGQLIVTRERGRLPQSAPSAHLARPSIEKRQQRVGVNLRRSLLDRIADCYARCFAGGNSQGTACLPCRR